MSPLPESLLESVAAAAVREGLADALFTRLPTPIGRLLVVSGPEGLVRIAFESEPEEAALAEVAAALGPRVLASDAELRGAREALSGYFEGEPLELPVDLRLARAPFRHAVLERLREVPRGQTVSYGELAARAGHPKAARAVGTACARNPVPIVVPCHRVLPGTGRLGSYRGGPERKAALLALEGVTAR
jgi:methylated-DNA-[protein]-cysteine S-methyltransferase